MYHKNSTNDSKFQKNTYIPESLAKNWCRVIRIAEALKNRELSDVRL